jgi:hypothetical protein
MCVVADYNGPGADRIVFTTNLDDSDRDTTLPGQFRGFSG